MVKKNVLTPVLAGVLGVTIAGSGVGYYLVNKNADKESEKTKAETMVVSPKLSVVAENISNTLSRAQDVANGELDYAYEGNVNISFGTAVTNATGMDLKDINMKVSSKQKGGNEGGDITMSYDGKDLFTVNEVVSRDNGDDVIYARVPELSDAYLKASKADAEQYMKDQVGYDIKEYTDSLNDIEFDADTFEAEMKKYQQVVRDNFPEVKEEGKKTGDIDGISYEYTSKSYDVTSADAQKIADAVLDTAKTDENIKKIYDDGVNKMMEIQNNTMYGESDTETPSYEEMIDKMKEETKESIGDDDKTVHLETYENADGDFMGFKLTPDGEEGEMRYVIVSQDDAEGMDVFFDGGDGNIMTAYGSMKSTDDTVNGTYTITAKEDEKETVKVVLTVTDVKAAGKNFSGTIRFDGKFDEGNEAVSGWYEIASASTEDDVDLTFDFGLNGENAFTMKVTSNKTEASDIELPGADAKVYNALDENELNEYLEGCDLDGFQQKVKDAVGEELYDQMFAGSSYDDYPEFDPDDVVEEEDFDWEQFNTDDISDAKTDEPA